MVCVQVLDPQKLHPNLDLLILGCRLVTQTPNLSTPHFPSHARLTTRRHQPRCFGRVTVQVDVESAGLGTFSLCSSGTYSLLLMVQC